MRSWGYALVVVPVVIACGGRDIFPAEQATTPPSSVEQDTPIVATPPSRANTDVPANTVGPPVDRDALCAAGPPPVMLYTPIGSQAGVLGSTCTGNEVLGCGSCDDRIFRYDKPFLLLHPGDNLRIDMPGAQVMGSDLCMPACPPSARVHLALCEADTLVVGTNGEAAQRVLFQQDEPWVLDVQPGVYFLFVTTHFASPDGWSGQTNGLFGLIVDPSRERTLVNQAPSCGAAPSADAGTAADSGTPE
jgi:hypothetical protein